MPIAGEHPRMQASCRFPIRQPPESHRRGVVLPEQITRLGHECIQPVRSRHVHHTIDDDGHSLGSRLPRAKRPCELQPIDVVCTNLPRGRIAHRARIVPIGRPIGLSKTIDREAQYCGKSTHPTTLTNSPCRKSITAASDFLICGNSAEYTRVICISKRCGTSVWPVVHAAPEWALRQCPQL